MATLMSRLIAYAFLAFISSKGLLATYYLTPGCVGGGVKLGSETSSGVTGAGDGSVWKSSNLEKMNKEPVGELEGCK